MSPSVSCREFAFGSDTYRASVELREAVLRRPLGRAWEPKAFDKEEVSFHLGAFADDSLVGTLILVPAGPDMLKMRQVAVAPETQGQGVGTALVRFSEQFAADHGYTAIIAHARQTAVPFYRRLGYSVESEEYLEVGIPHVSIRKSLPSRSHTT